MLLFVVKESPKTRVYLSRGILDGIERGVKTDGQHRGLTL